MGTVHPRDIPEWTLSEVFLFLEDPDSRGPDGSPNMNEGELAAAAKAWESLSALEKLKAYRW